MKKHIAILALIFLVGTLLGGCALTSLILATPGDAIPQLVTAGNAHANSIRKALPIASSGNVLASSGNALASSGNARPVASAGNAGNLDKSITDSLNKAAALLRDAGVTDTELATFVGGKELSFTLDGSSYRYCVLSKASGKESRVMPTPTPDPVGSVDVDAALAEMAASQGDWDVIKEMQSDSRAYFLYCMKDGASGMTAWSNRTNGLFYTLNMEGKAGEKGLSAMTEKLLSAG